MKRSGFCLLAVPLIALFVGSMFIFGHCHHGCGSCLPAGRSKGPNSSCCASECASSRAHAIVCQKCGKIYEVCSSHGNGRLCSHCLESLQAVNVQQDKQTDVIVGHCKECGVKYTVERSDDCGLCSTCFQHWCSCKN